MQTEQSGWSQFTVQKRKMVSDFLMFKDITENRPTFTDKGKYAEALFREWLERFLPARYGVTSGYIIPQSDAVKPRSSLQLRHYDVIIYNRLESQVLWAEVSPDHSMAGRIRAIPAEYVHAVLEIKSTFNAKSINDGFKKLDELAPLLGVDGMDEHYQQYISPNFYMGMVFFELQEKQQANIRLINMLAPKRQRFLRGFFGGVILSAEGLDHRNTCQFWYQSVGNTPLPSLAKSDRKSLVSQEGAIWSDSIEVSPGDYRVCMFGWSASAFAIFAHDLIHVMNGTYRPGFISSWHGLNFPLEPKP